ncbi:MAG: hypothetical protein QF824_03805 [Candidatus Woesearchaeota archaeon]|jgi:chemotaxis protein histidine kinase CheA|nr:hypothetical protein [Candidatus Woesearchaeota archaeon]
MDNEQEIRIEEELKFLKESLESGIISQEEFNRGIEGIDKKKEEIEKKEKEETKPKESQKPEEEIKEESIENNKEEKLSSEKDPEKTESPKKEVTEEKITEKVEPTTTEEETKVKTQSTPDKEEPKPKESQKPEDEVNDIINNEEPITPKEKPIEETQSTLDKEEIKEKKPSWTKWARLVVMILLIYFLFKSFTPTDDPIIKEPIIDTKPECINDNDCLMENKIGTCTNPNTQDAKCEYTKAITTSLTIINKNDCPSCDADRMTQIIKRLFPGVIIKHVEFNTQESSDLITELNLNSIPSYIFDNSIKSTSNFNQFKSALIQKDNKFTIKPSASGANYYFTRPEEKNKLELFVINNNPEINKKVEDNVNEVISIFNEKISYSKRIISNDEKDELASELGITSFPSFVINNQLKFGGIRSPEIIKEKFCELNNLEECQEKLKEKIN